MIHEYIIKVDDEKKDIMGNIPLLTIPNKLIRCKDCRHWDEGHTEECENSDSVCFHNGWCPPEFFCGDGEAKDGDPEC